MRRLETELELIHELETENAEPQMATTARETLNKRATTSAISSDQFRRQNQQRLRI